jgi:hypothetical protein
LILQVRVHVLGAITMSLYLFIFQMFWICEFCTLCCILCTYRSHIFFSDYAKTFDVVSLDVWMPSTHSLSK